MSEHRDATNWLFGLLGVDDLDDLDNLDVLDDLEEAIDEVRSALANQRAAQAHRHDGPLGDFRSKGRVVSTTIGETSKVPCPGWHHMRNDGDGLKCIHCGWTEKDAIDQDKKNRYRIATNQEGAERNEHG